MNSDQTIFTSETYALALALVLAGVVGLHFNADGLVSVYGLVVGGAFIAAGLICALGRWVSLVVAPSAARYGVGVRR
jgi:hypothetical protein